MLITDKRYGQSYQLWMHIIVWSLLLLLPFIIGSATNHFSIGKIPALFFVVTGFIHIGLFYGNAFFLYPKLYTLRHWLIYLLCMVVILITVIAVKHYMLLHWFGLTTLEANSWRMIVAPVVLTFLISLLYRNVIDKNRIESERQETKSALLAAELQFLRSQISPHFMFNVLTNLVTLSRKKSDQLEPALLMLSGLMRYMLYDTRHSKISLQQEIEYLENYIALQRLRFADGVKVDTDISAPVGSPEIEPMLLIPFVENAFKHGICFETTPWVYVLLKLEGHTLIFEVLNNYTSQPAETKDQVSGIGIENVSTRLQLLYKDKHTLTINKMPDTFHVQLKITLL